MFPLVKLFHILEVRISMGAGVGGGWFKLTLSPGCLVKAAVHFGHLDSPAFFLKSTTDAPGLGGG